MSVTETLPNQHASIEASTPVTQTSGPGDSPEQIGSALPISAMAPNATRHVAFQNSTPVEISAAAKSLTALDISQRVRTLAAQGLKVRDISSLLHIHPLLVQRVLESRS